MKTCSAFLSCFLLCATPGFAQIALDTDKRLTLYGDLRLRHESDFNATNRMGAPVEDRDRIRTRIRTGLRYRPNETLTFETRLRTGSNQAQQSPHVTLYDFQGNDSGDANVNPDRWFMKAERDDKWFWVGRNNFPFWSLDEVFWDEDATILGLALGSSYTLSERDNLTPTLGLFTLPVGMREFSGTLAAVDLVYAHKRNGITYSLGSGYFAFLPDRGDDQTALLADGNGFRDYRIGTLNSKTEWQWDKTPLAFEAEYLKNFEDYSPNDRDPYTAQNYDQREGYVLSIQAGDLGHRGNWMGAYYFTRIEALAVNSSFASDEWTRWSSGNGQNRSNDMRGHQFNLGYAFSDNVNLLARAYFAEAITTQESGDRFRLDLNYKF